MRLADEIILHGLKLPDKELPDTPEAARFSKGVTEIRDDLRKGAVPIRIDSVVDYAYSRADSAGKDEGFFDYCPPYRSPFGLTWMEWNCPANLKGLVSINKMGAMVCSYPSPDNEEEIVNSIIPVVHTAGNTQPCLLGLLIQTRTDKQGNHNKKAIVRDYFTVDPKQDQIETHAAHWGHPILLALAFCSCKNVVRQREDVPPKLQKRYMERHKEKKLTFYSLNIEPMKRVLSYEGRVESQGLGKALHICRGHFATYTEERKLFGRVAGTFWIPQHVKGVEDKGIVVKDYKMGRVTK